MNKASDLPKHEQTIGAGNKIVPRTSSQSSTLIDLLRAAVDKGADVATLERLAKLYEAAEENEKKKEFYSALAEAKAKLRPIIKDQSISLSGGKSIKFESMAAIAEAVDPVLADAGLFYTFPDADELIAAVDNKISVTCRLSHRNGYSIQSTRSAPPDVGQNRNAVQAMGSTLTYLQRYTLKAVLGLAVSQDKVAGEKPRFSDRAEMKPAAAQAAHEYDAAKPELIQTEGDEDWQHWTAKLLRVINAAATAELVEQWMNANTSLLGQLLTDLPAHHQFVMREIAKRTRKLRGA